MRPHSGYAPAGSPAGSLPTSGFFAGPLGSGGLGSGNLPMALSHPSGALGGAPNSSRGLPPRTNARRSSCSTACAVLGLGRVTGVYLFSCLACIGVAIAFNTAGPSAYEYYVSCHGKATTCATETTSVELLRMDREEFPERGKKQGDLVASISMAAVVNGPGAAKRTGVSSAEVASGLFMEEVSDEDLCDDDGPQGYAAGRGDLESGRNGQVFYPGGPGASVLVPSWRPTGICWNSTWVTMEYLIYGLGFYSAVLGWRVYGGATTSNFITLRTCEHMNVLSFGADLPLVDSIVSDFAFLETYLALATTMLIVRKYRDPYWLSSYCGLGLLRKCSKALKTVFIFQALLQVAILATAAGKIALCWMTGYGTPMQILSAFMLVSVVMWAVTVLGHVLQTERMNPPLVPTLEYHWLWAMICMAIIWFCGFLFYLSVYGVRCWPFLALHAAGWIAYVLVTAWNFNAIFPNWISGAEETDASFDTAEHRRVLRARHRGERSVRAFGEELGTGTSPFMRSSYQ